VRKREDGERKKKRKRVEEAVKEEDRECKRVGLTWRARQREGQRKRADAKARARWKRQRTGSGGTRGWDSPGGQDRERAKGRGPTQKREGAVEEAVKEEDREWRCKRADNEATPSQSTDMEACKGQIWRHAKGSRRRVENNRKRERAQREGREQNRRGSARRGARQSNPLPPV